MNDSKIKAYGWLKSDSPFKEIFPSGAVPLESSVAVVPSEIDAPLCYIVDANGLSQKQIKLLAELIFKTWQPECESLDYAVSCVRTGLPLQVVWFIAVGTNYRMFV